MTATAEVPSGQIKGPIPMGPTPAVPCGPCSLAFLQEWEKTKTGRVVEDPKTGLRSFIPGAPRPNIVGVPKSRIRQHLREQHGVDLAGQPIRFRQRRQGCTHLFTKSQKCDRCGVTKRDIRGRVKR